MAKRKTTLPVFSNREPPSNIQAYLQQVRQNQNTNSSEDAIPVDNTEKFLIPENSYLSTDPTTHLPTDLNQESGSPAPEEIEKTQIETPAQPSSSLSDMSEISDMSKPLDQENAEEVNASIASTILLTPSNETGNGPKRRAKGVSTASDSALVDYLQKLPIEFTNYSFTKGEMKVRVSEDMAYFLKLLSESCPEAKSIRYLSENLINRLLWQFFQTYGAEIEALHREMERERQLNHTRRMGSLKINQDR